MQDLIPFLSHNWAMSTALVLVFFMILFNEFLFARKKSKELSPQEAVKLINHESAVVFDLRDAENFKKNHIIDAVNVSTEDLKKPKMNRYHEKPVILVCEQGLKSPALAHQLRQLGFKNPLVLSGGLRAWIAAQLPTVKGK